MAGNIWNFNDLIGILYIVYYQEFPRKNLEKESICASIQYFM